jgi:TolB-like protein/Flp pilus assembly protein TadD
MPADSSRAVFLSYASQDAEAARRICESLRTGGVEVWFDADGGLEHGDEWDAKIRRQIKECVLFIPVISANTQAREEGYFRIEWELAAERAMGIASGVPFILPVVIDDTREPGALVPDRFRKVQWTKIPGGAVPSEVQARLLKLWSHRTGVLKHDAAISATRANVNPVVPALERKSARSRWTIAVAAIGAVAGVAWWGSRHQENTTHVGPAAAQAGVTSAPSSPSGPPSDSEKSFAVMASVYAKYGDATHEELVLAEELGAQLVSSQPTNADAWAAYALSTLSLFHHESAPAKYPSALTRAQRAVSLEGAAHEPRFALASVYSGRPATRDEGVRMLKKLADERPEDLRVARELAQQLSDLGRHDEAFRALERAGAGAGAEKNPYVWTLRASIWMSLGRLDEAMAAVDKSLSLHVGPRALMQRSYLQVFLQDDYEAAAKTISALPGPILIREQETWAYGWFWLNHRKPVESLARWRAYDGDFVADAPKGYYIGRALEMNGQADAARFEWRAALQLVDAKLATQPNDRALLCWKAMLAACLGENESAERAIATVRALEVNPTNAYLVPLVLARLGKNDEAISELASRWAKIGRDAARFARTIILHEALFDPLRSDPRFQAFVEKIRKDARFPLVDKKSGRDETTGASAGAAAKADPKTVAVLPFTNQSEDKANEFFSDGISEALAGVLGEVSGLQVAGWNSALSLKGRNLPDAEVAQKLGVVYVVTGSVQKVGSQVKISARLVSAADGFQVWSDRFTREAKDIFVVQDEIAGLIAQSLQLKLGVSSRRTRVVNPEAHRLVLEGRHFWNQRNDDGFARAEAAFLKAIDIDPTFAEAHAGLAGVYVIRGTYQALEDSAREVAEDFRKARTAATKAVEFGPDLAEAHAALAYTLFNQGDRAAAGRAFERALAVNPNSATTVTWSSVMQSFSGRLDDALGSYAKAATLDPLWFINLHLYAEALFYAARYEEALRIAERAAALRSDTFIPNLGLRAQILFALGRRADALAMARSVRTQLHLDTRWTADAHAIFVLRQCGEAKDAADYAAEAVRQLETKSPMRAQIFAALGSFDEALPTIGGTRLTMRHYLFWDPIWDPWRDDPRFHAALAQLGCTEDYKVARETLARLKAQAAAQK